MFFLSLKLREEIHFGLKITLFLKACFLLVSKSKLSNFYKESYLFFKPYNPLETFADFEISEDTEESEESETTEVLKKNTIFCLSPIRRTSGRKSVVAQNLHLLAGFHLSAFTYPPDPAV
jgi:hypothetical protein